MYNNEFSNGSNSKNNDQEPTTINSIAETETKAVITDITVSKLLLCFRIKGCAFL